MVITVATVFTCPISDPWSYCANLGSLNSIQKLLNLLAAFGFVLYTLRKARRERCYHLPFHTISYQERLDSGKTSLQVLRQYVFY